MTAQWPYSLPVPDLVDGHRQEAFMPKASFQPAVGPPIDRPRGTMRLSKMTLRYRMTKEQLERFEDFVFTDLAQGTQPFLMQHPRRKEQVKVRMLGDDPYEIGWVNSQNFDVSFQVMVIG